MRTGLLTIAISIPLGCSDTSVKAVNAIPSAEISSHSEGQSVFEGSTESFRGLVSDPDHSPEDLTVRWYGGTEIACSDAAPDSTGLTTCEILISTDTTEVILEVQDPKDGAASARVGLSVDATAPPTVEISAPSADGVYYSDQLIPFEGVVSDAEDAAADLVVAWESDLDGKLDVEAVPGDDGVFAVDDYLTEGEHVLTPSATDTGGESGSGTVTVIVGPPNSAPTCGITAPETNSADEEGTKVLFEATVAAHCPTNGFRLEYTDGDEEDIGVDELLELKLSNAKSLIGRRVSRHFPGHGRFEGEVTAWQEEGERVGYKLRYDDGDEESEIPMVEVLKLLMPESTNKKGKAKKRGRPSVE